MDVHLIIIILNVANSLLNCVCVSQCKLVCVFCGHYIQNIESVNLKGGIPTVNRRSCITCEKQVPLFPHKQSLTSGIVSQLNRIISSCSAFESDL